MRCNNISCNHGKALTGYLLVIALLLCGCIAQNNQGAVHYRTRPVYVLDPKPQRILLLNTCNVDSLKYRKIKSDLFKKFLDSVLITMAKEINSREAIYTAIIPGLTNLSGSNDSLEKLMGIHNATHAIVVTSLEVAFDQEAVTVTKTSENSKSRQASYNLNAAMHFQFYNGTKLFREMQMTKSIPHSSRPVVSGLLAAGPNIVSRQKDAWQIINTSLTDFLNLFFESN